MCTFAAIAAVGTAISIGSEVVSAVSANEQAAENKKSAEAARAEQFKLLGERQQQIQASGTQTIMAADRKAREAEALARVSAGESNVAGVSVDALLGNLERQRIEYERSLKTGVQGQLDQLQAEKLGINAQADARIAQYPGANPWATGLQIGGTAAQYAAKTYAYNNPSHN